jgi:RNA polymerase sigma-70 factor (ECF subfamily)
MLARCLARLREEFDDRESAGRFEALKPHLVGGGSGSDSGYEGLARALGTTEAAARVAVHRLRKRFSAVLREEVLRTVGSPDDVDAEIRWLLTTVRSA